MDETKQSFIPQSSDIMKLLEKLHYKGVDPFLVMNQPYQLNHELDELTGYCSRTESIYPFCRFVLCFVFNQQDLENLMPLLIPNLEEDALFWIAYPKRTSKQYKTDLTRDSGWERLGKYGYEPVSLISLNDDFSIFRFRQLKYIKTMIRSDSMKLTKHDKNIDV
jgi:hypothetical protein